ncbi:MAG: hypothetical protein LBL24_09230 [Bacteroidales bacterium]|nr:hypothetical protein [Bacteroidales bacterium]
MKTFVTFFVSIMLSSVVAGQPYQGGKEYKAKSNTYRCEYGIAKSNGRHFYGFTNTKNIMKNMNSGLREYAPLPVLESQQKLIELLCEVYGGKEKMQAMGSEMIHFYFYVGMDFKVKEMRITVSSDTEQPKTTILQVEAIENLVKERIRFVFERDSPYYRDAIFNTASGAYTISEIPELLEKMP